LDPHTGALGDGGGDVEVEPDPGALVVVEAVWRVVVARADLHHARFLDFLQERCGARLSLLGRTTRCGEQRGQRERQQPRSSGEAAVDGSRHRDHIAYPENRVLTYGRISASERTAASYGAAAEAVSSCATNATARTPAASARTTERAGPSGRSSGRSLRWWMIMRRARRASRSTPARPGRARVTDPGSPPTPSGCATHSRP